MNDTHMSWIWVLWIYVMHALNYLYLVFFLFCFFEMVSFSRSFAVFFYVSSAYVHRWINMTTKLFISIITCILCEIVWIHIKCDEKRRKRWFNLTDIHTQSIHSNVEVSFFVEFIHHNKWVSAKQQMKFV